MNCEKSGYPSKKDATTAMNWRVKGTHRKKGRQVKMRVYSCPDCGRWHMTHQVNTVKRFLTNKPKLKEIPEEYTL